MVVFHARNCIVKMPMLVESNRLLDFGRGFYTTDNREQAVRFAKSVVGRRGGSPLLNVYDFDADVAFAELLTKRFETPTASWLDFVVANRSGSYAGEHFDLVVGPVANDSVYTTIGLYQKGLMSREATIGELRVHSLYNQIVFDNVANSGMEIRTKPYRRGLRDWRWPVSGCYRACRRGGDGTVVDCVFDCPSQTLPHYLVFCQPRAFRYLKYQKTEAL